MSLENKESVAPVDAAEDESDTTIGSSPHHKRNIIIAASIAAIILLAGAGGGYAVACNNVNAGMQAAAAQAASIDQQLSDKLKEAQTLLDGTTKEQVADEAMLTKLADAIKTAGSQQGTPDDSSNPAMVWTLLNMQSTYDTDTQQAQSAINRLTTTMDAVNDSINDKQLTDAKDALSKAIDAAQSTLDGSDGKVQDNATRDALSKALDAAKKALDGTDAEAMNTAKSDVENKANAVNDSVKAKEQADAEAQAQAEAAAAAASANTGYTGGGYTGGGYTGGGYNGGYSGGYTGGGSYGGGNSGGYTGSGDSANNSGDGWYHGGDKDSMGNVWTELEGDSWGQQMF